MVKRTAFKIVPDILDCQCAETLYRFVAVEGDMRGKDHFRPVKKPAVRDKL